MFPGRTLSLEGEKSRRARNQPLSAPPYQIKLLCVVPCIRETQLRGVIDSPPGSTIKNVWNYSCKVPLTRGSFVRTLKYQRLPVTYPLFAICSPFIIMNKPALILFSTPLHVTLSSQAPRRDSASSAQHGPDPPGTPEPTWGSSGMLWVLSCPGSGLCPIPCIPAGRRDALGTSWAAGAAAAVATLGGEQAHLHTRHREAKECEEYDILCLPGFSCWEEQGLNHIMFPLCSPSISTCNAFPSPPEHLAESKRQISQGFKKLLRATASCFETITHFPKQPQLPAAPAPPHRPLLSHPKLQTSLFPGTGAKRSHSPQNTRGET